MLLPKAKQINSSVSLSVPSKTNKNAKQKAQLNDNRQESRAIASSIDLIQKKAFEDEELVQGKFDAKPTVQKVAAPSKPNNTGLPDDLKAGIENVSGYAMDDVKVHYNSTQPAQLNAHAYAQGTDIHLAPGQEKHLPHEAWHVVQQKQGRVKPTMQMKGKVNINDDAGLEREADVMGARALQAKTANSKEKFHYSSNSKMLFNHNMIQRFKNKSYQPNLNDLEVPFSKFDSEEFVDFKRPTGWYKNTFEVLLDRANTITRDDPFNPRRQFVLVHCQVTGQPCTVDALDIGHKENWGPYVHATQPETYREGINAYNDLDNLRLESASANRSGDFETDSQGHFKDLPEKGKAGSKEREFYDYYNELLANGKSLDEYDLSDSFIYDGSEEMSKSSSSE